MCTKIRFAYEGGSFKSWLIVQSAFDRLEKRAVIVEPYQLRAAFIMTVC